MFYKSETEWEDNIASALNFLFYHCFYAYLLLYPDMGMTILIYFK